MRGVLSKVGIFLLITLSLWAYSSRPHIELSVSPKTAFLPLKRVDLRAELRGDLGEEWECPGVVWFFPDGTKSIEQSDCDPGDEPQRVWRRSWKQTISLGDIEEAGFEVRFYHNDELLGLARTKILVKLGDL